MNAPDRAQAQQPLRTVTVRYFAAIREALGTGSERLTTPAATLSALRDELIARGGAHAETLARGKAVRGDKTMVDVLLPALDSLEADARRGADLETAILDAVDAADEARDATAAMVAQRGRSALRS